MSEEIVRNIIETRLQDNWVLTDIDWDNIKYVPKIGTAFITPMIDESDAEVKGLGCIKRTYTLLIEVRAPRNKGTAVVNSYIEALKTLFGGYIEGNFYCLKGRSQRVGITRQWFQKNVIFTCKYKQIG